MKVKEESKKVGLKLNIEKAKIMASSPITSCYQNSGDWLIIDICRDAGTTLHLNSCSKLASSSQETPEVTGKFGLGIRNEAGQRWIEFCQENTLVITNTLFQQHKRRLYTWTSPDGQHWNQIDYILCSQRWKSSIQSAKTRPGDHELIIAKFRLKLKKVRKTTRPFMYDLSQIPYDYTMEVRNRLKGGDLIDREPAELWNEVRDIVQETGIKTIPMEKKCKKAKWLSGEALQIAVKRREEKKQRRKGKI